MISIRGLEAIGLLRFTKSRCCGVLLSTILASLPFGGLNHLSLLSPGVPVQSSCLQATDIRTVRKGILPLGRRCSIQTHPPFDLKNLSLDHTKTFHSLRVRTIKTEPVTAWQPKTLYMSSIRLRQVGWNWTSEPPGCSSTKHPLRLATK